MTETERVRFDRVALECHAEEYCKGELRLVHELTDCLRSAAVHAPAGSVSRISRITNDAECLARYFSKMNSALIDSAERIGAASQMMLEHLDSTTEELSRLLK